MKLIIGKDDHGRRVDRILRKAFPDLPLSLIHRLFRKKQVLINNIPVKIDSRVHEGDILSIKGSVSLPENTPKQESAVHSGKVLQKLDVLYEGSGLLILNKASGVEVHGENSLETMVQAYLKNNLSPSLSFKPGPLHRLDKPTSGIIAFSTSLDGAQRFSKALQQQKIRKYYLALMDGIIQENEVWEDMLFRDKNMKKTLPSVHRGEENEHRGQKAVMKVIPLCTSIDNKYTLALIELETGRTHQIRAQGSIHHHPLAGDKKYGGSQGASPLHRDGRKSEHRGFFLHAWRLSLPDGIAPDLPSLMTAPIPAEKKHLLSSIFGNSLNNRVRDKMQKILQNSPHLSLLDDII